MRIISDNLYMLRPNFFRGIPRRKKGGMWDEEYEVLIDLLAPAREVFK